MVSECIKCGWKGMCNVCLTCGFDLQGHSLGVPESYNSEIKYSYEKNKK